MAEENLPGPGLAISDKGGLCRVFSPAAPIFEVQGTVVGTARQNISMVGCCRLPPVNSPRASGVHRMLTTHLRIASVGTVACLRKRGIGGSAALGSNPDRRFVAIPPM